MAAGQETHKTRDAPPFTPPITAATGADILDGAKNHNDDAKAAPACGNGKTRITQGERDTRLTQLAGAMRRHGMDAEAIYAGLAVHNATHCEPPLSETELRR